MDYGWIVAAAVVVVALALFATRRYQRFRVRLTFEVERRDVDPEETDKE